MADERMGDLMALDAYAPDDIVPPPYRAPGQDSMAAKIGAAILTAPVRAAMYPGQVWRGEANPYEGTDAADWAAGMALSNVARSGRMAPEGAIGAGGGRLPQPSGLEMLRQAADKASQDYTKSLIPPPLTNLQRMQRDADRMPRSDFINSDRLWATARDISKNHDMSFGNAFRQAFDSVYRNRGAPLSDAELTHISDQAFRYGLSGE